MICCYLLYSGLHASAEDALACYDEKRTKDRKGVTIPSQRRYVQYFAKLIQCGLKYERTTLQLCEIRFADANALHSQGTVNCSISVLHDSSSVKTQTLQTHTIDFRKNLILEINNPSLSISGDIKVELTHKTSRKKIFHFWFNTYFVCDAADIESDGKCRKLVYTLHKNEIDDAHKDKEHKSFSEDFKVQIVLQPANPAEAIKAGINIVQRIEKKNHQAETQDLTSVQYNSKVTENSRNSSDLNNICDQNSTNSCNPCSNRHTYFLSGFEENNFFSNLQVCYAGSGNNKCNHYLNRAKKSNSSSFQRQCSVLPCLYRFVHSFNASKSLYNENYNQINFGDIKIKNHQCQQQNKHVIKNSLKSDKDIRSRKTTTCLEKYTIIIRNNSISKKSYFKSHSMSSFSVEENGEEFCDSYSHDFQVNSCPHAIKLYIHFSVNTCNIRCNIIELNILNENDDNKTVIEDNKISTPDFKRIYCSIIDLEHLLLTYFTGDQQIDNSIISKQNQLVFKLQTFIAFKATNNKNSLKKRHSKNQRTEDKLTLQKLPDCGSSCFPFYISSCSYKSSSLPITSKKKIKFKIKKNNTKFTKKFRWLHKSFRDDHMKFYKSFVQQTTVKRKSIPSSFHNLLNSRSVYLVLLPKLASLSALASLAQQFNLVVIRIKPFCSNMESAKVTLIAFVSNFNSCVCDKEIKVYSFLLNCFIPLIDYPSIQRNQDERKDVTFGNTIFKATIPLISKNIKVTDPITVPKNLNLSDCFPIPTTFGFKHFIKKSQKNKSTSIIITTNPMSEVNFKSYAFPFKFSEMENMLDNKEIIKISPVTLINKNVENTKKTIGAVFKLILTDDDTATLKNYDDHLVPVDDSHNCFCITSICNLFVLDLDQPAPALIKRCDKCYFF